MKKDKKEVRYASDWIEYHFKAKWIIIITIALCIISCSVSYIFLDNQLSSEMATYSETDYKYLTEIANNIYDEENKSINLSVVPDNVDISDIVYDKDKTTFSCKLDKNYMIAASPTVLVTLSDGFENITITELNPMFRNKFTIILLAFLMGLLIVFLPLVVILFILLLITIFSDARKFGDNCKRKAEEATEPAKKHIEEINKIIEEIGKDAH